MRNRDNILFSDDISLSSDEDDYHYRERKEKPDESIKSIYMLALLGFLTLLGSLVAWHDDLLLTVVSEKDAGTTQFSEERASRYLREIVGTGPRVAGTSYHLIKAQDLFDIIDHIAADAVQTVHTHWQFASGDNLIKFKSPFVSAYYNVSNIIALLEGESGFNSDGSTNSSILFNCHYDSVPTSPGASDNAVFCAAMIETLFVLSKRTTKFKHNIIFLFNGAEENPLQGSPGFLKHHWSKGVTALVNLDAAGTNCKPILFQVTDPRVLSAFRRAVAAPNAQSFGEALFSSGVVPSDTDFRIFRDLGHIYGVDVAFSKGGAVYHTRRDELGGVADGLLQTAGAVVAPLAAELADAHDFSHKIESSKMVYWDFLNLFMFEYDVHTAAIVDGLIIVFGLLSVIHYLYIVGFNCKMIKDLTYSSLVRIFCIIIGAIVSLAFSFFNFFTSRQLRYLSNPWLQVPMFWFPYWAGFFAFSQWTNSPTKSRMSRGLLVSRCGASARLLLLLLAAASPASLRYVLTLPLLSMAAGSFFTLTLATKFRLSARMRLALEVGLALPALALALALSVRVATLLAPTLGRVATVSAPDGRLALLSAVLASYVALPLWGVELLFCERGARVATVATVATLAMATASLLAPLQPYSSALQRHYWFHTEITSYNISGSMLDHRTGVWLTQTEANTPHSVLAHLPKSVTHKRWDIEDCKKYTFCNLPIYTPRTHNQEVVNGIWLEMSGPSVSNPASSVTLVSSKRSRRNATLQLNVNGPNNMVFVMWPRENVTLTSWSFESNVTKTDTLEGRPVYLVFYSRGTYSEEVQPVAFSLTFDLPSDHNASAILDFSLVGNRVYHPEEFTDDYRGLLAAMPEYFNVATHLTSRINYVF